MVILAVTEWTPTLTFIVTLWTLAGLVGAFTYAMFGRFRRNMREDVKADTSKTVEDALKPIIERQNDSKESIDNVRRQLAGLAEGVHAATELSLKHEGDINGKDGLFSRVSHIEGALGLKRVEPLATLHPEGGPAHEAT